MGGIRITCRTKHQAAVKLKNSIISYLYEQQYGELKKASIRDKEKLKDAIEALDHIIKLGKV